MMMPTVVASNRLTPPPDWAAATALINHFIHGGNEASDNTTAILVGDGRTVFHNLVVAAATSTTATTTTASSVSERRKNKVDDRNERKLDGLFLIEALCVRMKEMDCRQLRTTSNSINNNNNKQQQHRSSNYNLSPSSSSSPPPRLQSHFHRLLLARDFESGYTPLHHAIYHRDLLTVLLLLGHAADSSSSSHPTSTSKSYSQRVHYLDSTEGAGHSISPGDGGRSSDHQHGLMTSILLNQSHHHPLQLLNGNLRSSSSSPSSTKSSGDPNLSSSTTAIVSGGGGGRNYRKKNDRREEQEEEEEQLLRNVDDDDDDERRRNNMAMVTVNKLAASTDHENLTPLQLLGKTSEVGLERCRWALLYYQRRMHTATSGRGQHRHHRGWQRRRRRRMISFGDDRDYDALNFEIENEEDEGNVADDPMDDDEPHHYGARFEGRLRRRGRGNSFHDIIDPDEDDDGDHRDDDLRDDENVDAEGGDNDSEHHPRRTQSIVIREDKDEYGCEVLTFGRADHYALGVPQFTTASSGRGSVGDGADLKRGSSTMMMTSEVTCKPRRVEAFALSELRRNWSNTLSCNRGDVSVNDANIQASWDGAVDSPAVAIAASTHHTLVSTQSGRLYAFGYGKSGRLGTGDESHRPLPTPIFGQLANRVVVSIAAAENHSLCSTSDGKVFAWGSNSFGQLGIRKDSDRTSVTSRLSPRRVEGLLKQSFVVAVAAGDRHSVALTKSGEVYCWGDNKSGQLGMYNGGGGCGVAMSSPTTAANNGVASPTTNGRCHGPQRVEGLWSTQPRRRAIAIAAAEFSTLVLTLPPARGGGGETSSLASLPVNCIYGWGHGNHSVTRVVFPVETTAENTSVHVRFSYINPTSIACAKYHNVAITVDGRVFTWGLHLETLGIENSKVPRNAGSEWSVAADGRRPRSNSLTNPSALSPTPSSMAASSPQLVVGMLPENGGGKAVAVSASESHTAVITSDGHLFTWGTSIKNNLLGHKGVKWQPSPRKVQRVHRAVAVAAAKEHTVLLMATIFPPLPESGLGSLHSSYGSCGNQPLTLQECAAIEISRNVDLFNVVPTALVARRLDSRSLINFCDEFMRKNLDGVLAVGNKNEFASFLSVGRTSLVGTVRNGCKQDGTFHPFLYDLANSTTWFDGTQVFLKEYAIATQRSKDKRKSRKENRPSLAGDIKNVARSIARDKNRFPTKAVSEEVEVVLNCKKASSPQIVKGNEDKQSQVQRTLFTETLETKSNAADNNLKFHCDVCNVVCPDCNSYTLHINGRKHRNRLNHVSAEEERKVAECMMETKRMMMMKRNDEAIDNVVAQDRALEDCNKPFKIKTPKSAWANNTASPLEHASERRERSKSFQEILNEQQQQSIALALNSKHTFSSPTATKRHSGFARAGAAGAVAVAYDIQSTHPVQSFPLSEYMKKGTEQKRTDTMDYVGASRGDRPPVTKDNTNNDGKGWGFSPANKSINRPQVTKSFSEIQQEEEALRSNEDHMCRIQGHWYVQQREQAASIGEIQEQEQKDKEMQLFIEEQRRIENEILSKTMNKEAKRNRKKHVSRPTNSGRYA